MADECMADERMTDRPRPSAPPQPMTARRLLSALAARGLVAPDDETRIGRFLAEGGHARLQPLAIRLLLALGAVLAAASFVAFLGAAGLIEPSRPETWTVSGAVFMAVALLLQQAGSGSAAGLAHSLWLQTSFSAMATGKILLAAGLSDHLLTDDAAHFEWKVAMAIAIATAPVFPFYRLAVDRFLSVLALLGALLVAIVSEDWRAGGSGAPLTAWFIAQLVLAGALLAADRARSVTLPIAYALIFSLCAITALWGASSTFAAAGASAGLGEWDYAPNSSIGTAALAATLIALIAWTAGGADKLMRPPMALACLGAALLAALQAPGALLSIGLMTLGRARHDRLLAILGALLLPAFLTLYSYNLNLNYLWKSAVLIASGGALLAGRALMRARGWDAGA